jgi:hypothetical protein
MGNRSALAILGMLALYAGCAPVGAVESPRGTGRASPEPVGLLAPALAFFAARNDGIMRVDPRPLRTDAKLTGVFARDFDVDGTAVARVRRRFLREHGIPEADAAADMRCVFSRGMPRSDSISNPAPDSLKAQRAACLLVGPYTTFVFTRAEIPEGEQAVRFGTGAVRLLAYRLTTWSFEVWILYLQPSAGSWRVADSRRVVAVAS